MQPHRQVSCVLAAASLALACAQTHEEDVEFEAEPLIYGKDDRLDVYAEPDATLRNQAATSVLALIAPQQLRLVADDGVRVVAAPLSTLDSYCSDTPFLEQPTAAVCSATLVDSDLVLTASHCIRGPNSCRRLALVAGYAQAAPDEMMLSNREDVYGCRTLALRGQNSLLSDERFDFAFVQLDRAARGAPVDVRAEPRPQRGDALTVIGCPEGLPLKIDSGAVVDDARSTLRDSFTLTSDTFHGSSGSAVFDSTHKLVGVFASGTSDVVHNNRCARNRVIDPSVASNEMATSVARAIDALCASGWPSARLCGRAPSCGDGICSVTSEDDTTCRADCAPPSCGDSLCERAEWNSCDADCGDRRPASVPDAWYCRTERFADGNTCDCGCGAPDTDCIEGVRGCEREGPNGREPVAATAANCAAISPTRGTLFSKSLWLWLGLAYLVRRQRHDR